jgi:hypothetical protein
MFLLFLLHFIVQAIKRIPTSHRPTHYDIKGSPQIQHLFEEGRLHFTISLDIFCYKSIITMCVHLLISIYPKDWPWLPFKIPLLWRV